MAKPTKISRPATDRAPQFPQMNAAKTNAVNAKLQSDMATSAARAAKRSGMLPKGS